MQRSRSRISTYVCRLGVKALALCALAASARSQNEAFDASHATAVAAFIHDLTELVRWCDNVELFLERERVLQGILVLDAENEFARKGLRYSRDAGGMWIEPPPREAKNRNQRALEELPARRSAAATSFRTQMLNLCERERVTPFVRRTIEREILIADPDDATIRAARREKKVGDEWVLIETWRAKQRRAEIKAVAAAALGSVPSLVATKPTHDEASLGIPFRFGFTTPDVRVLATGDEAEASRATEVCHATGTFFRALFGVSTQHAPGYAVYLLANKGEKEAFLQGHPKLDASYRKFLDRVVGAAIPGEGTVVYWDSSAERRIDGAARQTLGDFLRRTFGIDFDDGWVWEGFGLYLNRELAGTRLTWFVQYDASGAFNALRARLMQPETNWMNEARILLGSPIHPRFTAIIEHDINAMGIEDMLYAYALAAYMVEGHPAETPELLRRIGSGREPTASAVEDVLHTTLDDLEERLYRWLCERR